MRRTVARQNGHSTSGKTATGSLAGPGRSSGVLSSFGTGYFVRMPRARAAHVPPA